MARSSGADLIKFDPTPGLGPNFKTRTDRVGQGADIGPHGLRHSGRADRKQARAAIRPPFPLKGAAASGRRLWR